MDDLTVCRMCGGDFVYPVDWHETGATSWHVLMRCGNCGKWRVGNYEQHVVDAFDAKLDAGTDLIVDALRELTLANMAAEIDQFVDALTFDVILPEDF